jgi:hypothetical protein
LKDGHRKVLNCLANFLQIHGTRKLQRRHEVMDEKYITMHEEINRKKWPIGGPLLELCVLSLIPVPKAWKSTYITEEYVNITEEDKLKNKIGFLESIVFNLRKMQKYINIVEDNERIKKEIELLAKNEIRLVDMRILINIDRDRKGRILMDLANEKIVHIKIVLVDTYSKFGSAKKIRKLLPKMIKSFNGICGSICYENDISAIIAVERLLQDGNIFDFRDLQWNRRVKFRM